MARTQIRPNLDPLVASIGSPSSDRILARLIKASAGAWGFLAIMPQKLR